MSGDEWEAAGRRSPRTALGWFRFLARHPTHYRLSDRSQALPIPWPDGFDPRRNPVFAHNALEIPAPADVVFSVLVDATGWPVFYPNAADVRIEGGAETLLRPGARFAWKTFATWQRSEVVMFERDVSLGWTADSPGTRAFHRWVLEPTANGTRVVTEECQHGMIACIDRRWMNRSLSATHQIWLERLRDHVRDGAARLG